MYQTYAPATELSRYIECFWRWTSEEEGPNTEFILPGAAPELIVHLGALPTARSHDGKWQRQIKEISGLPPSRLKAWLGRETYRDLYASRPAAPWIEK